MEKKLVYLLVNPALSENESLAKRFDQWSWSDQRSGAGVVPMNDVERQALLTEPNKVETGVSQQLGIITKQFLDQIFSKAIRSKNLGQIVADSEASQETFILFCFDLRDLCIVDRGSGRELEIELVMSVYRIVLASDPPWPVRQAVCFFQDRARGRGGLPADTEGGGTPEMADVIRRAVAVATVNAIRNQIALNLLDNPKLQHPGGANSWLEAKAVPLLAPRNPPGGDS